VYRSPSVRAQRVRDLTRKERAPARKAMPKEQRVLTPGRRFATKHKGQEYTAVVTDGGQIDVEGLGTFKSLNTAGVAIFGHPVNAWLAFHEIEVETPAPGPAAKKSRKAKKEKATEPEPAEAEEPAAEGA
jgi:hypothetical protein